MKGFDAAALAEQLRGNPDFAQANAANEAVQELLYSAAPKANKYHAVKTTIDGITFDSRKEADEYGRLKLLEQAGVISDLELQPRFELQAPFTDNEGKKRRGIYYVGDFAYTEDGVRYVVDTKGYWTADFKRKAKMFRAKYQDIRFIIK